VLAWLLDRFNLAFWLRLRTEFPNCIYYFGPFATERDALTAMQGYREDLAGEGIDCVYYKLKRMAEPRELTLIPETEIGREGQSTKGSLDLLQAT
jgi:hypothetical protein